MSHADLAALLARLIDRWGTRPDILALRLAGELEAHGLAIVPRVPTDAMVHASRRALYRHAAHGRVSEHQKHALRLTESLAHGAMEVRIIALQAGPPPGR